MSKISKTLLNAFKTTNKELKISEFKHQKNIDKIIDIIKPIIKEKHYKNDRVNWEITGIEFCNDEYMSNVPTEYEKVQITEEEYYKLYNNGNKKLIEDWTDEGEFLYYQERVKKYEYLRVYVHESWSYGGYDDKSYDFLMNDIMDTNYLRKEKLLKIKEESYV
jgi:hypothetical protein